MGQSRTVLIFPDSMRSSPGQISYPRGSLLSHGTRSFINREPSFMQSIKAVLDVAVMLLEVLRADENVVELAYDKFI